MALSRYVFRLFILSLFSWLSRSYVQYLLRGSCISFVRYLGMCGTSSFFLSVVK